MPARVCQLIFPLTARLVRARENNAGSISRTVRLGSRRMFHEHDFSQLSRFAHAHEPALLNSMLDAS